MQLLSYLQHYAQWNGMETAAGIELQLLRVSCRFAHGAEALLDLACGRGGDLHKWKSAQVLLHTSKPLASVLQLACAHIKG
jgi:hypothetical protein